MTDKLEQAWTENYGENDRKEKLYVAYTEWLQAKGLRQDVLEAYLSVGATHMRRFYQDYGAGVIPETSVNRVEELAANVGSPRMVVAVQRKHQDWRAYYMRGKDVSFLHVFVDEDCFSLQGWK